MEINNAAILKSERPKVLKHRGPEIRWGVGQ